MNDDIQLIIKALENYTGLPWDYIKTTHPGIAKLLDQNLPKPCTDTISRQAAIAVANRADYRGLLVEDVKKVTDEVVKGLKQLPSAQLEIIACNQCVYYQQNHHYCEFLDTEFSPSDYCSMAERREV